MMRNTLRRFCVAPSTSITRHNGQTPATTTSRGLDNFFNFDKTSTLHGFEFLSSRTFPELNICAYEFRHIATNASYIHLDAPSDTNNAFCMGFRTPAVNSKGTTHVLEHTVLCGSKQFPVRDPFFLMTRRSLATFMNAMTGMDYTLYPFSTTNAKDFGNLLQVYCDAVLFPLLRPEDFHQEAHRVELKEPSKVPSSADAGTDSNKKSGSDESVVGFNGVVLNEMRGVVSQPGTHFMHASLKAALPSTHYTHVSGGYPEDILKLTHAEVVAYHQKHYHPSNSVTMTYGDMYPHAHMKHLNEMFRQFEKSAVVEVPTLPESARFTVPKRTNAVGPSEPMGDVTQQKRVAVSYAAPSSMNQLEDTVRMCVLDSLLSSGQSSPMYEALITSRLGSGFSPLSGCAYYLSSPCMSYGVEGAANTTDEKVVEDAITKVLEDAREKGFDQRRVQSVVFQQLLQNKHRTANYGVDLTTGLATLFITRAGISALDFVDWTPHLEKIAAAPRQELDPVLDAVFLKNAHRSTIAIEASETYLRDGLQANLTKMESELNAKTSQAEKEEIGKKGAAWLERVRAPPDTACLPTLTVKDIPTQAFVEPAPITSAQRATIHTIPYATNGLVYLHGIIPSSAALRDAISKSPQLVDVHTPLYTSLLSRTGAGNMDFKEVSVLSELVSSGFGFSQLLANRSNSATSFTFGTKFGFHTTKEKLPEALRLFRTIVSSPRVAIDDSGVRESVHALAADRCASKVQGIQRSGHVMAMIAAGAEGSPRGAVRERWNGLTHCEASSDLLNALKANPDVIVSELIASYGAFATDVAANMGDATIWATCEPQDQIDVTQQLVEFQRSFSEVPSAGASLLLELPRASTEGTRTVQDKLLPIDTGFAARVIPNSLSTTDRDQQALRVAAQLVSGEFLHRCIREEGGAYGSTAASNVNGDVGGVSLASYRDPTPDASAAVFDRIPSFLGDAKEVTQQRVDEGKLRLFAAIDSPVVPQMLGEALFSYGTTHALRQQVRELLLSITREDVQRVGTYFNADNGGCHTVLLKPKKTE